MGRVAVVKAEDNLDLKDRGVVRARDSRVHRVMANQARAKIRHRGKARVGRKLRRVQLANHAPAATALLVQVMHPVMYN